MTETKEKILEEEKKGNVIIASMEGLSVASLKDIIKQPTEGLLYDLNRDRLTVLTIVENNPKWINDFAVCQVITALKSKIEDYQKLYGSL